MVVGIDYGSKLAGTTAIAFLEDQKRIMVYSSKKKEDADQFIKSFLQLKHQEAHIFIDVPLSLPGVYSGLEGLNDFFYRSCDKKLNAMSPMFLGGLTARAMKLKSELASSTIHFHEAYPKYMAKELDLVNYGYKGSKQELELIAQKVSTLTGFEFPEPINSWHQLDAVLALLIGIKHQKGEGQKVGLPEEGLIHI